MPQIGSTRSPYLSISLFLSRTLARPERKHISVFECLSSVQMNRKILQLCSHIVTAAVARIIYLLIRSV